MGNKKISVVLIDDHILLRNGLANLIETFGDYKVLFQSDNGQQFIAALNKSAIPDIVLLDINMPIMDGYETARWLQQHDSNIRILALSMYDNENSIIRMIKNGARGYILKDSEPFELKSALDAVIEKGYYYSDIVSGSLIHSVRSSKKIYSSISLNERETTFLKYACTELTYKEIADKMNVSPRTVDGYRDALFDKLEIKTRVGLVIYAIKNSIVKIQ